MRLKAEFKSFKRDLNSVVDIGPSLMAIIWPAPDLMYLRIAGFKWMPSRSMKKDLPNL